MLRLYLHLDDATADGLTAIAAADGRNVRRVAADLLTRAVKATELRRAHGASRRLIRAARDMEAAAADLAAAPESYR